MEIAGEPVVEKMTFNGFVRTNLDYVLRNNNITVRGTTSKINSVYPWNWSDNLLPMLFDDLLHIFVTQF